MGPPTAKRVALLLVFAATALSILAPAASANVLWRTVGEGGVITSSHTVLQTGGLKLTGPGGLVMIGPCMYHSHSEVENLFGFAISTTTDMTITAPCPAITLGIECEVSEASANVTEPWMGKSSTGNPNMQIEGVNFQFVFEGCPISEAAVAGTLTGNFNNETHCLEFNNSGDLKAVPGGSQVLADGALCDESEKLLLE